MKNALNPNIYKRKLTRRYMMAIVLIALTILSSYTYLQYQLQDNENQAEIINISGRQRMLSQRIAFFASNIAQNPFGQKEAEYGDALNKSAALMLDTHERLVALARQNEPHDTKIEKDLYALYFSAPHTLDQKVRQYLENATLFMTAYKNFIRQSDRPDINTLISDPSLNYIIQNAPDSLLDSLDEAVSLYQRQSETTILRFQIIETILLFGALTLLLLEILFIFRPMVREAVKALLTSEAARLKAENLSRLKSEFLNNINHEIRTPLHGILGSADLLEKAKTQKEQDKYIGSIKTSSERLMERVGKILIFSRIQSNEVTLEHATVATHDFIKNLTDPYKDKAASQRLDFEIEYEGALPGGVILDDTLLAQTLTTLLDNAFKFTERGLIKFIIKSDTSSGTTAILHFEIIDTGMGIEPDKLETIFDTFIQGDAGLKKKHGGMGLGLAIADASAKLMGTTIQVDSTPGNGSRFWFELTAPMVTLFGDKQDKTITAEDAEQPPENSPAASSSADSGLDIDVLLVENEMVNQMVATDMLERMGCRVDLAENGQEALDLLQGHEDKYAVILMDCMMPVMDGFEATQAIRKNEEANPAHRQRIIALTANVSPEDREKCLDAGMDDYLSKPITEEELSAKIKNHLQQGEAA